MVDKSIPGARLAGHAGVLERELAWLREVIEQQFSLRYAPGAPAAAPRPPPVADAPGPYARLLRRLGLDPDARLLRIGRSKGDQEGKGATAFLSPRSVRAIAAWTAAADIEEGPLFRRVQVRRYKARAAVKGRRIETISGRESWDLRKTLPKSAVPAAEIMVRPITRNFTSSGLPPRRP